MSMPAAVSAGDLLLALVGMDSATTTITTPNGWTVLIPGDPAQDPTIAIYGKVAVGTEGGTTVDFVTSTSERGTAHVYRCSAWQGTLDGIVVALGGTPVGSAYIGLSIGSTAKDVLWIVGQGKSTTNTWGTVPSGYGNETKSNVSEDSTSSCSIASATRTNAAASETVSTLWNTSASTWIGILVAVLPAGG